MLLNKSDLPAKLDEEHIRCLLPDKKIITTSIATGGVGIDELIDTIKKYVLYW